MIHLWQEAEEETLRRMQRELAETGGMAATFDEDEANAEDIEEGQTLAKQ